jgi:hypothetical protein
MSTTLANIAPRVQLSAVIASGRLSGTVLHQYNGPPIAFGTAVGQVNLCATVDFTVTSGTPYTLDLTALTDAGGSAITFGHLTHLQLENMSVTTGQDFTLGGGTNGVFTAAPNVIAANGGLWFLANPSPGVLVDSTHKIISISVAVGTGVSGRLTLFGRTT